MKIKICGIRNVEEAQQIYSLRPDAIGILVQYNKDYAANTVSQEFARRIVEATPSYINVFILTEKADAESNIAYCRSIGNRYIQLTGDIPPEEIDKIKEELPYLGIIKVIHVTGEEALGVAKLYEACDSVDELLLDSRIGRKSGGTGRIHDWELSRRIVEESRKYVWLAGGLTTKNLREAIETVRPYGVDVETGVQNADGSKNYDLIREFISVSRSF